MMKQPLRSPAQLLLPPPRRLAAEILLPPLLPTTKRHKLAGSWQESSEARRAAAPQKHRRNELQRDFIRYQGKGIAFTSFAVGMFPFWNSKPERIYD
jgi:hypothetical protein